MVPFQHDTSSVYCFFLVAHHIWSALLETSFHGAHPECATIGVVLLAMPPPAPFQTIWEGWPPNQPSPRPSPDDVEKAPIVHDSWNSRLVRVGTTFVIKYGIHVEPEEGHNMAFVAKSTAIPDEDEMIACLVDIYEQETRGRLVAKIRYYREVLADAIRHGGPVVFTHADLQRKNIMLRPDGTVVLIDWEYACWYPAYW